MNYAVVVNHLLAQSFANNKMRVKPSIRGDTYTLQVKIGNCWISVQDLEHTQVANDINRPRIIS